MGIARFLSTDWANWDGELVQGHGVVQALGEYDRCIHASWMHGCIAASRKWSTPELGMIRTLDGAMYGGFKQQGAILGFAAHTEGLECNSIEPTTHGFRIKKSLKSD